MLTYIYTRGILSEDISIVSRAKVQGFQVYIQDLLKEIAAYSACGNDVFNKFQFKKIIVLNGKLDYYDKRTAVAMALKVAIKNSKNLNKKDEKFYFIINKNQLDATKVFYELTGNKKLFKNRDKELSKINDYYSKIIKLSEDFSIKPDIVAKYASKKNKYKVKIIK